MKKVVGFILSLLLGMGVGAAIITVKKDKAIEAEKKKTDKFKTYYNMLNQWLILNYGNKRIEKYFQDNNYRTIAIYGLGEMGNRLYEDLKSTTIEVQYGIDENSNKFAELKIVSPEDEFEKVDAIIVSAIFAFEDIKNKLEQKTNIPIISLEEIIFSIQ